MDKKVGIFSKGQVQLSATVDKRLLSRLNHSSLLGTQLSVIAGHKMQMMLDLTLYVFLITQSDVGCSGINVSMYCI